MSSRASGAAAAPCHTRAMRPTIAFDLDGTLVDSLPDIVASFLHAFDARGLPRPSEAAVRATIGQPLEDMAAAFAPPSEVGPLCDAYRAHYPRHFRDASAPFPGVPELLTALGDLGYARVVATTKRTAMARAFVEAMGLDGCVDHVQGTDGFPHKPAPDVILHALRAVDGRGTWMVGDTVGDVLAGRAAGLKTYAVSWGTHGAERLREARPDVLAPDLSGLLSAVARAEAAAARSAGA